MPATDPNRTSLHRAFGRRPAAGLALAGVAIGVLGMTAMSQGCSFVISDGTIDFDAGDTALPAPDAGVPVANGCSDCLFQSCSGQYSVCANDRECFSIYQCATAPGCDQTCVTACYNAGTARGQRAYYALASCDAYTSCNACASTCNPAPGTCATPPPVDAGADAPPPPPPDAGTTDDASPPPPADAGVQDCTTCTSSRCANEKAACGPGTKCDLYAQCLNACRDVPCIDKCGADNPDGKNDSAKLSACVQANCASACGL